MLPINNEFNRGEKKMQKRTAYETETTPKNIVSGK